MFPFLPESRSKKNRLDNEGAVGGAGDELEMDFQESNENVEKNEDQEMIHQKDSTHSTHQPKICPGYTTLVLIFVIIIKGLL